jgi:hypothetical protein
VASSRNGGARLTDPCLPAGMAAAGSEERTGGMTTPSRGAAMGARPMALAPLPPALEVGCLRAAFRRWRRPDQTGAREGQPLPRRIGVLGRRTRARWWPGGQADGLGAAGPCLLLAGWTGALTSVRPSPAPSGQGEHFLHLKLNM